MPPDEVFNSACIEARTAMDYRKICLFDVCVRRERLGESFHRLLRLRNDDEPRSVLVESVDDSRARDAADSGERGAVVEKGVDERSREMPWRRMNDHSWRFVDDDHVVVFENDVEWNILWLGDSRNRRRNFYFDLVRIGDFHSRLVCNRAVYRYMPGFDKTLYSRPREVGIEFKYFLVEGLISRSTASSTASRRSTTRTSSPSTPPSTARATSTNSAPSSAPR